MSTENKKLADRITKGEAKRVRLSTGSRVVAYGKPTQMFSEASGHPTEMHTPETTICEFKVSPTEEANAELIAEAFNVTNETGLSPKEMKEQMDEAIDMISKFSPLIDELINRTNSGWQRDLFCDSNILVKEFLNKLKPQTK